jgi:hypothetical protein
MNGKDNITSMPVPEIDPGEFSAMETEAEKQAERLDNRRLFTYVFPEPWEYMGKKYNELSFDFWSLKGSDCVNITDELVARGITVVAPEFSQHYQLQFAARACTEKLPSDALLSMPAKAYQKIVGAARNFIIV